MIFDLEREATQTRRRKTETTTMEVIHRCNYATIHIAHALVTTRMLVH
jgi:hypothetical protein